MSAAPPHPSSTLVNVAENAELRLVQLLADSCPSPQAVTPNFQSSCEAAVGNADAAGLIRAILGDSGAIAGLLAVEPTEEAVSAFSLLAALLDRVESEADQSALVAAMAHTITVAPAAGADGGKKKAAMLAALYNLRSSGVEKVDLLARIVTLSAESDPKVLAEGQPLGDVLDAANVKKMTEDWGVGRADQRKLYRAIADGVGKVQGGDSAARRQKFLLSALGTYAEASEVDADALATAKDAAVGAIQDPVTLFAEQRGMLLLPAVAALGNGAGELHRMCLYICAVFIHSCGWSEASSSSSSTITSPNILPPLSFTHQKPQNLCLLCSRYFRRENSKTSNLSSKATRRHSQSMVCPRMSALGTCAFSVSAPSPPSTRRSHTQPSPLLSTLRTPRLRPG